MKSSFFLTAFLLTSLTSGCAFFRGTDNQGTEYMINGMIGLGCFKNSPCNFLTVDGPAVYMCTEDVPDHSVRSGGDEPVGLDDAGSIGVGYTIYSDGTGEVNANVAQGWTAPMADPEMLTLSATGNMLQCGHLIGSDADYENFSCIISSCIAFVEQDTRGGQKIVVEQRKLADSSKE